jgi:outer membrane protein assembly factor BamE (lipoprotein component of BamABCDE complex)
MRTFRLMLALMVAALLSACGTNSQDLDRLALGMDKQQVIHTLGKPHTMAAHGDTEFLVYWLDRQNMGGKDEYFVELTGGKVTAYGPKGSFGTTAYPTEKVDIHTHDSN